VSRQRNSAFLTVRGREFIVSFWEFAAFLANSLVFLLIGVDTAELPFRLIWNWMLLASAGIVLAGRALTVIRLVSAVANTLGDYIQGTNVLWWGGLRGALSLALALSLPIRSHCATTFWSSPSPSSPSR